MELVKVSNIELKLTDGKVLPFIRAVVKDMAGAISKATLTSLLDNVYTLANGMHTVTAYSFRGSSSVSGMPTSNAKYTYGDNTGFKIVYTINNWGKSSPYYARANYAIAGSSGGFFYKGRSVAGGASSYGSGDYSYAFLVVFTDENYNLYTFTGYPPEGIIKKFSSALPITVQDLNGVISIPEGGTTYAQPNATTCVLDENIKSYVVSEYPPEHSDPFNDGGTSEPGGGGGSFDDSTDVITTPEYDPVELLNRSYGNRGFVHVYLPTQAELTSLHAFMWDNALITEMQKMFNNVVDSVISLNLIPLDFTDETPNRGNILMGLVDSQIETTIAKQQFITLDCGTIEINEFFASYLDYSPYSKLQIYLPYIGVKDLDIDEFMNASINVKYVVDIVSGACVAFISKSGAIDNDVVKDNPILGVLYQFAGNCALNVPISGANYAQVHAADIGAIISGAGIVGAFATGGMSAPAAVTGVLSTAANVITSKPSISRGGSIPSTAGYMGVQKPYLILTRPRMCLPEDQNTFTGYPAYVTLTPGDTSGYTEFEEIHLENIPATDVEKDEIMNLMKTGVIL